MKRNHRTSGGGRRTPEYLRAPPALGLNGGALDKLIITVAPTGSVPRKKDTPHVPVTPDEIAETAYRCEQEGAAIIHVHCRDDQERPTSHYEIFRETVDKIRRRTKLVVMTSTSGIAGTTDGERAEPLRTKPEMGSLTTGSLNFAGRKPSIVYVNTVETVQFLAKRMLDLGIKPEIEAFDVGFISQGRKLIETGLVQEPAHFQLVMGVDGGVPATIENVLHMRDQLPPTATYVVAGMSRMQLPMTTMAILMGGHVRVGLEDNLYLRKGVLARNEELVARARHLAEDFQREVASPDEARKVMGLAR
ncbi:MAG TPA: 3-keto-5-aminohexanoate cleavage protein [Thermoplasmata archaeon]|nr:3-keto-5-aminohexanoate cleavage protein [Thermoplasmata archaeon]